MGNQMVTSEMNAEFCPTINKQIVPNDISRVIICDKLCG